MKQASSFTKTLLEQPRRLWVRKAVFQVHLWVGLAASVYLLAISLSGTVLVFKDELVRWSLPSHLHAFVVGSALPPESVLQHLQDQQPGASASNLQMPSSVLPVFVLEGKDQHGTAARWIADPVTGTVEPVKRSWIDWVRDLHYYLLLPQSWGMQVNGVGALALLLLAASGLILWWPGTRVWSRGLRINLRASWRRINYDLHSAIGFWTLAIVVWWALSGVYFAWYQQVTAALAIVSPVVGMAPPKAEDSLPRSRRAASLALVLATAQQASPHGRLWSFSNPELTSEECYVLMDRGTAGDFSHRDIIRVGRDARIISVWHYGERHTIADWILWSTHPLHFGTLWGLPFKLLWATLGLSLSVLTLTGLVLYWNRYLSRFWHEPAS